MNGKLPDWAAQMCDLFRSGSISQFILHGNIFDVVPDAASGGKGVPLKQYLSDVLFENYDVILHYDRGKGIRAAKGAEDWGDWVASFRGPDAQALATIRESGKALELIDRYLLRTINLQAIAERPRSPKIAVIIDFAEFVAPSGYALQLGGEFAANVVKLLGWANDPAILRCNIVSVLLTEGLHDLNDLVVSNPRAAKLKVPLPGEEDMLEYMNGLSSSEIPALAAKCEVPLDVLARRLTGLSRIGAHTVVALALRKEGKITHKWLSDMKKEMIERECQGLLEFLETPFNLDQVAGLDAAKAWLRDDTKLLRQGAFHALPMGYLVVGRIGTGKTYLIQCWAGELGIPCVVFKNFRDRWVGATESNLEKIFSILHALGQVVVFVDEADQAAGKRESSDTDGGLSGRVYSMLAKEMSDTRNRGRIVWVFATSRPDLLEVDLKRQGRLDVHIPLFPPETSAEFVALFKAVARKLKFPLKSEDLPEIPAGIVLGGNEIEGVLVRALRTLELQPEPKRPLRDILSDVMKEVRPSAHTRKLEYMDLIAVRECTDARFLPEKYRKLSPEEVERRIDELRRFV
jgi:AAA+ superfamily predicted ATPase